MVNTAFEARGWGDHQGVDLRVLTLQVGVLLVGDGGHGLKRSLQRGEEVAQLSLLTVDKVQLMVKLLLLQLDPLQVRVQLHNLMKQGTIKTSTSLSKKKKLLVGETLHLYPRTYAHTGTKDLDIDCTYHPPFLHSQWPACPRHWPAWLAWGSSSPAPPAPPSTCWSPPPAACRSSVAPTLLLPPPLHPLSLLMLLSGFRDCR